MLFLGIISWKGASCFNGLGGFIFKWGVGVPHGGASGLMGSFSKKLKHRGGHPPHVLPTMGNPVRT